MNSLRNNGKSETALAIVRSSNDPPKYFPSVNIDIPQTPALSYPLATFSTDRLLLMFCLEGERLLCSAIIPELLAFKDFANDFVFLSKRGEDSQ